MELKDPDPEGQRSSGFRGLGLQGLSLKGWWVVWVLGVLGLGGSGPWGLRGSGFRGVEAIDPYSNGGANIDWKYKPNPEDFSQLMGWGNLQGMRLIKPDDSHNGDRFGRSTVIHGDHLIVAADMATCGDSSTKPGGVCDSAGKGAVYVFERDYVTSAYYRWDESTQDTTSWGGYPTSSTSSSHCDSTGDNCRTTVGFCTDSTDPSTDGVACNANNACANSGTCRYAPPFTVNNSKFWGQRVKLQPSDLVDGDRFGSAIAFDGVTNTLVVGAPRQSVPGRCGTNYVFGIREGEATDCIEGGAVYVFQKDYGGTNNWGQVAKLVTTPGAQVSSGTICASGYQSEVTGNGNCPGSSCIICSTK